MPKMYVPFTSSEFSVYNEIYSSILDDVSKRIGVDENNISVLFRGIEQVKTNNENNVTSRETSGRPVTTSRKRVVVNVNQKYDEDNISATAFSRNEHFPIFHDDLVEVSIAPVYIQMECELEFVYVSPSASELNRIRDNLRLLLSESRETMFHDIEYTMFVPDAVESFILDIYNLRNRLIPSELGDYFTEHSSPNIHSVTDMSNQTNTRLGIRERQTRVLGFFDFPSGPENAESDNDTNTNKFSFTYKFSVTIPKGLKLNYPLIVCNKTIPEKWWRQAEERARKPFERLEDGSRHIGKSYDDLSRVRSVTDFTKKEPFKYPINIPAADDYNTVISRSGYAGLLSILLEVDETDKRSLFNLRDLGDLSLATSLIEYIEREGRDKVVTAYNSQLFLGLVQKGRHYHNDVLYIDEDLNVISKIDLDIRTPVRVVLSHVVDTTMLTMDSLYRLMDNDESFLEFVKFVSELKTLLSHKVDKDKGSDLHFFGVMRDFIKRNVKVDRYEIINELFKVLSGIRSVEKGFLSFMFNKEKGLLDTLILNHVHLVYHENMLRYNPPKIPIPIEERGDYVNYSKGL